MDEMVCSKVSLRYRRYLHRIVRKLHKLRYYFANYRFNNISMKFIANRELKRFSCCNRNKLVVLVYFQYLLPFSPQR